MNSQLLSGVGLAASAAGAVAAGVAWLAAAAVLAAVPYLVVGVLFALGRLRERGRDLAVVVSLADARR
jgi:ABC-type maltose transport system permease subunit